MGLIHGFFARPQAKDCMGLIREICRRSGDATAWGYSADFGGAGKGKPRAVPPAVTARSQRGVGGTLRFRTHVSCSLNLLRCVYPPRTRVTRLVKKESDRANVNGGRRRVRSATAWPFAHGEKHSAIRWMRPPMENVCERCPPWRHRHSIRPRQRIDRPAALCGGASTFVAPNRALCSHGLSPLPRADERASGPGSPLWVSAYRPPGIGFRSGSGPV
jgi:hypothetical protein